METKLDMPSTSATKWTALIKQIPSIHEVFLVVLQGNSSHAWQCGFRDGHVAIHKEDVCSVHDEIGISEGLRHCRHVECWMSSFNFAREFMSHSPALVVVLTYAKLHFILRSQ